MMNVELKNRVHSVASSILKESNYISPVDMLIKIGVLSVKDYENWRFGRVPYLEKVCKTNLSKLSFMMNELRAFSRQNNLQPSWNYCLLMNIEAAVQDKLLYHNIEI